VEGGLEELFVDTSGLWSSWDVYDGGICYVETPPMEKAMVMCHDFATRKSTAVAVLDKLPSLGFSVSRDGQWILYSQEDVSGSDLVLVENFR
jgi:hypothetical protein